MVLVIGVMSFSSLFLYNEAYLFIHLIIGINYHQDLGMNDFQEHRSFAIWK